MGHRWRHAVRFRGTSGALSRGATRFTRTCRNVYWPAQPSRFAWLAPAPCGATSVTRPSTRRPRPRCLQRQRRQRKANGNPDREQVEKDRIRPSTQELRFLPWSHHSFDQQEDIHQRLNRPLLAPRTRRRMRFASAQPRTGQLRGDQERRHAHDRRSPRTRTPSTRRSRARSSGGWSSCTCARSSTT